MKDGEPIFVVWCETHERVLMVTGIRAKAELCAEQHEGESPKTCWAYVLDCKFTE